ncbi:MAG: histidine kinase [Bacteroidetes bacterium]|nr:histidine kinase [Bacteroidota bacterium]
MSKTELPRKIRLGNILMHLLFWMLSLVLFTVLIFYTRDFRIQAMDFQTAVNILVTLVFLAVSVYINLLWLLPFFFNRRRYGLFTILQVLNIALFICLNYFVSFAFEGGNPNVLTEMVAEFILVLVFLVVSTLIKFTRDSVALQDAALMIREIEQEKTESELRALKAQLNPHFYFNTLNSIYSLSLDKSEKTPELILRLSELMRYILYETQDAFVPMERQLVFLRNYISLEELRIGEKLKVEMEVKGDHTDLRIAPLLFVPFIENAFKHVPKEKNTESFIRIVFDLTHSDSLIFSVKNNKYEIPAVAGRKEEGIGLANVRRRLNLLYPAKHQLTITEPGNEFHVELQLVIT